MKAVIALGSNLENRKLNLDIAITHLEGLLQNIKVSPYIETKPVGGPIQDDFINAVVIGDCQLTPENLLTELLKIEDQMGRVREVKWGPRIIDLDLIVYGEQVVDSLFLKLPHPLAQSREFVLKPWLAIDPEGVIPGVGAVKTLLASIQSASKTLPLARYPERTGAMIEVIKSVDDLSRQKWDVLVPTMGALHAGHQSLIKLGRNLGEKVIVSIFVNPLQFENKSDLESYPKSFEQDLQIAKEAGATAVFTPSESDIYPGQIQKIEAGILGDIFEGKSRPGHFSGVLTVVKRLFDLVKPKYAVFGEKDFQQLFLIKKMVKEFNLPVNVVAAPTIRDSSNLALSSRNSRLSGEDIKVAQVIYQALTQNNIDEARDFLKKMDGFSLDYLEQIDEQSFNLATPETKNKRLIIAGWVNQVRLIDNIAMGSK